MSIGAFIVGVENRVTTNDQEVAFIGVDLVEEIIVRNDFEAIKGFST